MSKEQLLEIDDIVTLTAHGKTHIPEKDREEVYQIKYIDTYFRQYLICKNTRCFYVNYNHVVFKKRKGE